MFMQWYCGGMASVAIIRWSDKAGLFIEKDSVVMMMIVVMVKMTTTMIMVMMKMMVMITVMPIIRRSDKAGLFIEKDLTLWEAPDGKHEKNWNIQYNFIEVLCLVSLAAPQTLR